MSNLLKSGNIIYSNDETKVIDYNALISEKICAIQESIAREHAQMQEYELVEEMRPEDVEQLLSETDEEPGESHMADATEVIASANEEAKAIINRAQQEADLIRADSANMGKKEGYEEGRKQAELELAALRKEIEDERVQMEIEYDEQMRKMEPMLVEAILTVFEKVTHVLSVDKKDVVLQLVNDVLSKTEISKEFLIRVSNADYKFMLDNRERITGVVSKKVQIEIVEDPTFRRGQCMIESDSGIYDCSLDIQLENLINTIKIMTCLVND